MTECRQGETNMRIGRWPLLLCVAMLGYVTAVVGATESASTTPSATVRVVVRPVTATGQVRAGFTLTSEPTGSVDCHFKTPSLAAVDPNIEWCYPLSEGATACWDAAVAHHVLCLRNPRSRAVVRIPRVGAFASTAVAPLAKRAPLTLQLADGDICNVRTGGTADQLPDHPNLFVTYYCANDGEVWGSLAARHAGVDEAPPVWTVETAPFDGHRLVLRHVVRAWFVGTYSG